MPNMSRVLSDKPNIYNENMLNRASMGIAAVTLRDEAELTQWAHAELTEVMRAVYTPEPTLGFSNN